MKQLTKAEEDIMQILWDLKEANVASIIEKLSEPKPAYNTVSTIVRILESKDFVGYRKEGRGHIYFPKVKKTEYSSQSLNKSMDGYFQGSFCCKTVQTFCATTFSGLYPLTQITPQII